MNGLKTFLALAINGVAILAFVIYEFLFRPGYIVGWVVLMMAVAATLGGLFGSHMAHRVGRKAVRGVVIALGFLLTGWYFYKTHGG